MMKPLRVLDVGAMICALYVHAFPRRAFPHWLDANRIARLLSEAIAN